MSGYGRTDYSQQGAGYARDRRYSGGRNDAAYGSGIRREENYRSEKHVNQAPQGEASSYKSPKNNFQASGRKVGGDGNEGVEGSSQGSQDSGYGVGRQDDHNGEGDDFSSAAKHATQHAGSSADLDIFSSVLAALGQNRQSIATQSINEQDAVSSHQQYFGGNGNEPEQATAGSMGSAAAMQALKLFLGTDKNQNQQGNSQQGSQSQVQGNPQNQFIGMALAEASKLFDHQSSQGNVQSGTSKQSVVQHAGEMALKMYLKGQGGSGPGGLLGKFL